MPVVSISTPVLAALSAAVLFGVSTPFAKQLLGDVPPILLAGLLYLGSGLGLLGARLVRDRGWHWPGMTFAELPWLAGAIAFGGILGPVLLMIGLNRSSAASASLLLNLESVLTAVLAWVVFRENADRRIVIGMLLIVAGSVVLSWPLDSVSAQDWLGPLAIAGACACWAIDNNLTRKVSASDPLFIAGSKGLVAGAVNTGLAVVTGSVFPSANVVAAAMAVGLLGYGVSLVCFVVALRGLGAARTGAYFSTAPFMGAAVAIAFFGESVSLSFFIAATLMGVGVWFHLTERHEHQHTHEPLLHRHSHVHDEHHQHEHDFPWDGKEPHSHTHAHAPITHRHPHYPDIHHRHRHV